MEFDEHEDQEDEMEEIQPLQPLPHGGYANPPGRLGGDGENGRASTAGQQGGMVRYRECLKNHAVGIGGNAVDGCGQFMAAGEEGTLDALRCAACSCHRNFHRKEKVSTSEEGGMVYHHGRPHHHHHHNHQFFPYYRAAPSPAGYLHLTPVPQQQRRPLALPSTSRDHMSNPSRSGGGRAAAGSMMKKRFRTKFTPEQKERMLGFAERLGWRIQKHDEGAVEQFCSQTGVKRQVLKVWMHNNRHTAAELAKQS